MNFEIGRILSGVITSLIVACLTASASAIIKTNRNEVRINAIEQVVKFEFEHMREQFQRQNDALGKITDHLINKGK